jgi:exosortase K
LTWALKHHYSVADATGLGWMLRPVALLLQLTTGEAFSVTAAGEWRSPAAGIVLVKACAGINFMIVSLLGWCWLLRPASPRARAWPRWLRLLEWPLLFAGTLALAWGTAILVNVARILLALAVGHGLEELAGGAVPAHRLIGLAVYLPALTAQMLLASREQRGAALLFAATLYLALMLVVPMLTGQAWLQPRLFAGHAAMVIAAVLALAAIGYRCGVFTSRRCSVRSSCSSCHPDRRSGRPCA